MDIWGLTGGIASGKSTVAAGFAARGVAVVDADALYHALIAPTDRVASALAAQVAAAFPDTMRADGSLDRKRLASIVFSDGRAKARLEAIAHPAVAKAAQRAFARLAEARCPVALYDVPLLFERGLQAHYPNVIVVWLPHALQLARLQQRDKLSPSEAVLRLSAQMPLDNKRTLARVVIDNSSTLKKTMEQVDAVVASFAQREKRSPAP